MPERQEVGPDTQKVISGGKGGKMKGFDSLIGEKSVSIGPAQAATKPLESKVNTPIGQVTK